jgi:hypothetical protein
LIPGRCKRKLFSRPQRPEREAWSWPSTTTLRRMGEWGYSFTIFFLGAIWICMVSFTPRPLHPRRKSPGYRLQRRLHGFQSQSGRFEVDKNVVSLSEIKPQQSSL